MRCLEPIPEDQFVCNKKGCVEAFRNFNKALKRQKKSDSFQVKVKLNEVKITKEEDAKKEKNN